MIEQPNNKYTRISMLMSRFARHTRISRMCSLLFGFLIVRERATYIHTNIYIYMSICLYVFIHTCIHMHKCVFICKLTYIYVHTYIHIYIYIYIYTYMYIYIYIYVSYVFPPFSFLIVRKGYLYQQKSKYIYINTCEC
jgi:hypothetical protein